MPKILNPADSPDYNKHAGQRQSFIGAQSTKNFVTKWVLTVNFNLSKDFNHQPCTRELDLP